MHCTYFCAILTDFSQNCESCLFLCEFWSPYIFFPGTVTSTLSNYNMGEKCLYGDLKNRYYLFVLGKKSLRFFVRDKYCNDFQIHCLCLNAYI